VPGDIRERVSWRSNRTLFVKLAAAGKRNLLRDATYLEKDHSQGRFQNLEMIRILCQSLAETGNRLVSMAGDILVYTLCVCARQMLGRFDVQCGDAETAVSVAFVVGECRKNNVLSCCAVEVKDGEDKTLHILKKVVE